MADSVNELAVSPAVGTESAGRPPRRLRTGMRLGVVAPSSPVTEPAEVRRGVQALEAMGFTVELSAEVGQCYGYLAGADRHRADGLVTMLERQDIDGIICLRGGYGASRTVAALDLQRLRDLRPARPKVFVGFSDITILHQLLASELGWTTFYGPMLTSFANASDYTLQSFRRTLMDGLPVEVVASADGPSPEVIVSGTARGPLAGGCLTLLCALLGTPLEPDFVGKVVFFEDVDAQPYQIDRLLSQLLAAGKLQRSAGILVGEHVRCRATRPGPTLSLVQVLADLLVPLGIPVLHGLPVGHGRHLATMPLGTQVSLDVDRRCLRAHAAAVAD